MYTLLTAATARNIICMNLFGVRTAMILQPLFPTAVADRDFTLFLFPAFGDSTHGMDGEGFEPPIICM